MPKSVIKTQPKSKKKTTINKNNLKVEELDIKIKQRNQRITDVFTLSKKSLLVLWKYRATFIGILLIYGFINLAVAQGFSAGVNVNSLKSQVSTVFHGKYHQITGGFTVFALMLASFGSGSSSPTTGAGGGFGYKLILIIIVSLAVIWAIRAAMNDSKVRIRDAYYKGMYPMIPFLAILLVIALELLPMLIGVTIYIIAKNNGIATNLIEQFGFISFAALLSALTIYWLSSSLFAVYIVTLPEMTPIKALRSAKNLVKKRRWPILLRLLFLPIALLVIASIIMLPSIILFASYAQWVFLLLSLVLIALAHSYLYNLYRELLE